MACLEHGVEEGSTIGVTFESAEGLQAGKSQLKYKDIVFGTVKNLELTRTIRCRRYHRHYASSKAADDRQDSVLGIWDLFPNSLGGIPAGTRPIQGAGTILYSRFVTLTTIGYGDIVPLHPLARSLANLDGIIGQLYPATLPARLVSLELETRRR